METNKLKDFFEENDFIVHLTEQDGVQCAEIETWTNGGVDMILWLNPFTVKAFEDVVNNFNVDDEIEIHRQGKDYKNAFTIKESLNDFEEYHGRLKNTLSKLLTQ